MRYAQRGSPGKNRFCAEEQLRPDVVAKREEFEEWMTGVDPERPVFVDETGCNVQLAPEHGWVLRGERLVERRPGSCWKSVSIVGAVRQDRVLCHQSFEGALNTERWLSFLEEKLCPNLYPGDIVVLDNLRVHKNKRGLELIRATGAEVRFQPPYSPEYNPIELVWAFLKHVVRKVRARTHAQRRSHFPERGNDVRHQDRSSRSGSEGSIVATSPAWPRCTTRMPVNHQVTQEPVEGRAAIRAMFEREFAAAEMTCIIDAIHKAGDVVALEWRDPLRRGIFGLLRHNAGNPPHTHAYQ